MDRYITYVLTTYLLAFSQLTKAVFEDSEVQLQTQNWNVKKKRRECSDPQLAPETMTWHVVMNYWAFSSAWLNGSYLKLKPVQHVAKPRAAKQCTSLILLLCRPLGNRARVTYPTRQLKFTWYEIISYAPNYKNHYCIHESRCLK